MLFRFENLADRSDQVNQSDTKYIDVKRFAKQFYQMANPNSQNISIAVTEKSITNVQNESSLEEELANRTKWKVEGDLKLNKTTLLQRPQDMSSLTALALEPQRIR